ncbi:MAG: HNH endonuclease [Planctomycetaceae bacterium]|nr:HNH endonuclease [Planctomycetaceae bacterium]
MITEFFDVGGVSVNDQFQAWRTNHQAGLFLTLATRTSANLHGARCLHLGSGPPYFLLEDGFGSLTVKRKVCGSEAELLAWATKNGVSVKRCLHCLRDNLIGNGQVQEGKELTLPEEVPSGSAYNEGSVQRILINRYERDPRAREECIRHYGTTCFLCRFDFVAVYGEMMAGFIHVHHLKPLSSVGADYQVDPIEDLRPVCPNCHAVIHRREPPYSFDEVRELM